MARKSNNKRWMMGLLSASIGLALSAQAQAKDVVVHLFEWNWTDIASECENYLGPKGFKAVQISPPTDHVNHNTWWARYQPVSYSNFTSRSGNEAELKDMITRCKAAGVEILADLVFNQMANYGSAADGSNGEGTSLSGFQWSSKSYTYDGMGRSDFQDNACSISGYTNAQHVWTCALSGMPDVKTSNPATQDKIAAYINKLKSFGVSMFRVDAAKHMAPSELSAILGKAGNPWAFLEVIGAGGEASEIQPDKYTSINNAIVTEFGFASHLYGAFNDGNLAGLSSIANGKLSSDKAFVFVTNHDRERGHGGGSTIHYTQGGDENRPKGELAHIFMLAYSYGTPAVHSGYKYSNGDQPRPAGATNCNNSEWLCQHRWPKVGNMVAFRNAVAGTAVANWSTDGNNRIAFARGNKGFVAINNESSSWSKSFQTGLPAGEYCDVLSGTNEDICSGNTVTVDGSGNATITIAAKSAAAIYVGAGGEPNGKPVVKITGAPTGWVAVGTSVTLSADANDTDNTDEIKSYKWSSGETTESITKVMATEGKQTFTVTVTDDEGETATATATINVGDEPATCTLPSLYLRGTVNAWNTGTALSCVGANRWEAVIDFTGKGDLGGEQRFKFTQNGDGANAWAINWGDKDKNGVLDSGQASDDIFTTVVGKHLVTVNDASASAMTYTITKAEDKPVDAKPVAKITNVGSLTVDIADGRKLVKLSGLTSSDAEGAVTYAWSRGAAASCLEGEATFVADTVGTFPITLTVKDSAGQTATDTVTVTVIDGDAAPAPVVSIQASSTSVDIKNGPQTVTFTAKITGDATGLSYEWSTGENGESITKTYSAQGSDSVWVDVTNADDATTRATVSVTIKDSSGSSNTGEYGLYRTNPNSGKGKAGTITIDGNPSDWTQDMLIAQGVANDDARGFNGGHEGPVYDLYALYASWDDANLYLMWQYTNVTDVVDPGQTYPISGQGKPAIADIPIQLAFDIDPSKEADGTLLDKGTLTSVWGDNKGPYNTFANGIDHLAMFSAKAQGTPAIFKMNESGSFDYGTAYVLSFKVAGIEYKWGDHQFVKSIMAVNKNSFDPSYTYASLGDASNFVDMITKGHDPKQDTIYEMKIPLATFGLTRAQLESQGIGVMLISTFGQSGIDSLPHDKTTLDNVETPYGPDPSSSAEKNDVDEFTAAPARIGK